MQPIAVARTWGTSSASALPRRSAHTTQVAVGVATALQDPAEELAGGHVHSKPSRQSGTSGPPRSSKSLPPKRRVEFSDVVIEVAETHGMKFIMPTKERPYERLLRNLRRNDQPPQEDDESEPQNSPKGERSIESMRNKWLNGQQLMGQDSQSAVKLHMDARCAPRFLDESQVPQSVSPPRSPIDPLSLAGPQVPQSVSPPRSPDSENGKHETLRRGFENRRKKNVEEVDPMVLVAKHLERQTRRSSRRPSKRLTNMVNVQTVQAEKQSHPENIERILASMSTAYSAAQKKGNDTVGKIEKRSRDFVAMQEEVGQWRALSDELWHEVAALKQSLAASN